jgi:hypothetical protein
VKLLDGLAAAIPDRDVLNLLGQMDARVAERGEVYFGETSAGQTSAGRTSGMQ